MKCTLTVLQLKTMDTEGGGAGGRYSGLFFYLKCKYRQKLPHDFAT